MTIHVPEPRRIEAQSLAQIFTEARTHNAFLDKPVSDDLLRKAVELAKMGPTSANQSPLRILFLRVARGEGAASSGCSRPAISTRRWPRRSSRSRPTTSSSIEHLPFLFPHADAKPWFAGDPVKAARSAFQNGTLQVAYLILALRAVGSRHRADDRLRQCEGRRRVLPRRPRQVERAHQHRLRRPRKLFPRSPRFAFDQIAKIL